MAVNINNHYVP